MTTEQIVWPEHFTISDRQIAQRAIAWIAERNYTQAALARLSRTNTSTLNQILKGKYATSPSKQLQAVESAMRNADEETGLAIAPVETSVFRLAHRACDMARRYHNFAVLSAWVGTGKTFALKRYVATHPNTYLVEATPTMTPQSLTKQLARLVLSLEKGSIADKFDAVVASLKGTDSLIIVDEAETLTHNQLETIRRIRDLAGIGIVLAGTEHLAGLIKPEHGQFGQIRSRTGFWPEVVQRITADDAAALVQSGFGTEDIPEDVIARMYAYSKGSARMLVEGLVAGIKEFRGDRELNEALVDAVAKQVLCLQSVA